MTDDQGTCGLETVTYFPLVAMVLLGVGAIGLGLAIRRFVRYHW